MYSDEIQALFKGKGISIGDRIALSLGRVRLEGELMPKANIGSPRTIVIKLDDGYNIGVKHGEGLRLERVATGTHNIASFPKVRLAHDGKLPRVTLVYTGGTIGSRVDYETGGVSMLLKPEELLYNVPEIQDVADVYVDMLMSTASEDLSYHEWRKIAEGVARAFEAGSRGVVVTIGTDTMHYTAAALSFMLQGLAGPVVLTGAQRSSDRGSSDGFMNLVCATNVAAKSDIAEVCLSMHNKSSDEECALIRGTRARKMHTSRRDAFRSINDRPIAMISRAGAIAYTNDYRHADGGRFSLRTGFEPKVALVKVYPNSDPSIIDFYMDKGFKGLIIEGTGLGHAPVSTKHEEFQWLPHIKAALDRGLAVGMTSQCLYGRVHPNVYKNLRLLSNLGVVYCEDMMPEVAQIKLSWLLGNYDKDEAKSMLNRNLVGEISSRSRFNEYMV